ncbi:MULTISPECIES: O-antigen ligase family protein [unclassified Marinomonas]|uniref:O-antigen ligase family protein n=1 Tax=unclassified Marinomonas TaxID=196814 RepID=UPI000B0FD214|nr:MULTISPECIES: O-antigen ligase family protein [unclassified Marinomonas]
MKKKFSSLIWFFAALTLALSIGLPDGYNLGIFLIFLSSFSIVFKNHKWTVDGEDRLILLAFGLYTISFFTAIYFDDGEVRRLDRPSRFILALPVLLLLLNHSERKHWLWYGSLIGAASAFIVAYYEKAVLGLDRAHGGENPIMFGNIGMMLGLINFVSATYFFTEKRYKFTILAIFAGFLGLTVSILSGTRGGWVALPIIGFFLVWQSRNLLGKRVLYTVVLASTVVFLTAIFTPHIGVKNRIDLALENIYQYHQGVKTETPVGYRFDMWKAAFVMFEESPIIGVGNQGSLDIKKRMVESNKISEKTLKYSHAHNEYFEALSKRGIIGLFFLILVYIVPLKLFLRKMKKYSNNWKIKSYAMAGVLVPMSYMDFSLTQVMFGHNIGVMMYAFPIVFFWAATRWAEREERELGNIA